MNLTDAFLWNTGADLGGSEFGVSYLEFVGVWMKMVTGDDDVSAAMRFGMSFGAVCRGIQVN